MVKTVRLLVKRCIKSKKLCEVFAKIISIFSLKIKQILHITSHYYLLHITHHYGGHSTGNIYPQTDISGKLGSISFCSPVGSPLIYGLQHMENHELSTARWSWLGVTRLPLVGGNQH